jgi:hypothetical protein
VFLFRAIAKHFGIYMLQFQSEVFVLGDTVGLQDCLLCSGVRSSAKWKGKARVCPYNHGSEGVYCTTILLYSTDSSFDLCVLKPEYSHTLKSKYARSSANRYGHLAADNAIYRV